MPAPAAALAMAAVAAGPAALLAANQAAENGAGPAARACGALASDRAPALTPSRS